MYRHIVLFRVHDHVTDEQVTEAINALRSLAALPGVTLWRIETSLDQRKGRVLVEDATFIDEESFAAFRKHPDHVAAGRKMSEISDWWNGDYLD